MTTQEDLERIRELLKAATNPESDYEGAGKGSGMISVGMKRAEAKTELERLGFANTAWPGQTPKYPGANAVLLMGEALTYYADEDRFGTASAYAQNTLQALASIKEAS